MLAGKKVRGAGTLEGVDNTFPLWGRVRAPTEGRYYISFLRAKVGVSCCSWALTIIHNLHTVLASCALLDGSKVCCLCCAECRIF